MKGDNLLYLDAQAEILQFISSVTQKIEFCILFGSSAVRQAIANDIDFKLVFTDEPTPSVRKSVARFAARLNNKYCHTDLEEILEVPYEVKTCCSLGLVYEAIDLQPYVHDEKMTIPVIPGTRDYLESRDCQQRVVLNMMTTPNILLYGDLSKYMNLRELAFKQVLHLVSSVFNISVDNPEIINYLFGPGYELKYKHYLGYRKEPDIISFLYKQYEALMHSPAELVKSLTNE